MVYADLDDKIFTIEDTIEYKSNFGDNLTLFTFTSENSIGSDRIQTEF